MALSSAVPTGCPSWALRPRQAQSRHEPDTEIRELVDREEEEITGAPAGNGRCGTGGGDRPARLVVIGTFPRTQSLGRATLTALSAPAGAGSYDLVQQLQNELA